MPKLITRSLVSQVMRYGFVGVANNLLGYLIYLYVTWLWLDPKLAVSLLYPVGAITAYMGHAKYAFSYGGRHHKGAAKYLVAHLLGYLVNVFLLYVFVDKLNFPHQLVQVGAIIIVSGVLFLLFRYYVFQDKNTGDARDHRS